MKNNNNDENKVEEKRDILQKLIIDYHKIEREIENKFEELPRFGLLCTCDWKTRIIFRQIMMGSDANYDIIRTCTICGGYVGGE